MMTSRERARKMDERIDDRSRRLKDRLTKRNASNLVDTNDAKKSKKMTTKGMLVTTDIVGKEKTCFDSECSDDDHTPPLAIDESLNDTILKQTNLFGKNECNVRGDNLMEVMTIGHEKKDEVSLLSVSGGPSRSTHVSVEDSVFNNLDDVVKSSWKQQTKGMARILGPCVRDEFVKDYKFCNEKICRHIVTKCMARNEIVLTPGMSYDQFVHVTSKSPIVSKVFNSQRHHIQSKMRMVHIGKKF